jgi:tetratricopeptide (TPR) repeat protein
LSEYYRALTLDPKAVSIIRRASELAARMGDAGRSLELADRGLALEPKDPRLSWLKGAAYFNLGRFPEALESTWAAFEADSSDLDYARTLARIAEHANRPDLVARAWKRATEIDPEDGESWFQLAGAYARLGEFDAAERALAEARDRAPSRPGLVFLQGFVKEGQGRAGDAITLYRRHLEIHPSDLATRRRLVTLLAREKRWEEAYREAIRVRQAARPGDWDALETEADLAFRAKHPEDAKRAVAELQRAAAGDRDRNLRVIALLARHGRKTEAMNLATVASRGAPDMYVAQARAVAGDLPGAIDRAHRAALAAPDSIEPRILLARLYDGQKRHAASESVWVEVLHLGGDSAAVLMEIAAARESRGDTAGAEEAVRDVLRIQPDHARALNFLGYLLADHNRSLEEALRLIRKALEEDPDNGAFIDSLGWVYYRLGRLGEARLELERAVHLTGGDPVVHEHLGDVYKDLRLFSLAREQYRKSLAQDNSNPKLKAKLASVSR